MLQNQTIPKHYYTNEHQKFLMSAQPSAEAAYSQAVQWVTTAVKNNIVIAHQQYINDCQTHGLTHRINRKCSPDRLIRLCIKKYKTEKSRDILNDMYHEIQSLIEASERGITHEANAQMIGISQRYRMDCKKTRDIAQTLINMTDYYKITGEVL